MARLIAPNGATVNVSDQEANDLLSAGYRRAETEPAKPAKTATRRKPARNPK